MKGELLHGETSAIPPQTALEHIDYFGPTPAEAVLIWIFSILLVLLIGYIFHKAINSNVKTDWDTFLVYFLSLSMISLVVYLVIS